MKQTLLEQAMSHIFCTSSIGEKCTRISLLTLLGHIDLFRDGPLVWMQKICQHWPKFEISIWYCRHKIVLIGTKRLIIHTSLISNLAKCQCLHIKFLDSMLLCYCNSNIYLFSLLINKNFTTALVGQMYH